MNPCGSRTAYQETEVFLELPLPLSLMADLLKITKKKYEFRTDKKKRLSKFGMRNHEQQVANMI